MSSRGRQIAKSIGRSIKRKFEGDLFQFPLWLDEQQKDLIFLATPPFNTSPHSSPPLSARRPMHQKMQAVQPPKKSNSLGTIAHGDPQGLGVIEHDEIISLTHDVKKFSDSLARLKILFTEGIDPEEDGRVVIHEGLGEVLSVLNPVMQHYPALQSPDIFTAARSLITMIKDHNYEEELTPQMIQGFCEAIDQLALAFSSSVSEYLMGDMGPQMVMDLKTKSMNNIAMAEEEELIEESDSDPVSSEDLDRTLVCLESGLSIALSRAKVWSKYVLDIITYIEKKAQLEIDYAKNLVRLAHSVQHSLKKEGFLPLQSVYCTALSQDADFAASLQATQAVLHSQKFVQQLSTRRAEHDKVYKNVKEVWHREYRRVSESITNLRKAQALYHNRQQDHERARELSVKAEGGDKMEKRRKAEEEANHKAAEAETTYKACVADANYRQQELFKVKKEQLGRIREQIQLCDQVIKSVTVDYFQLYHTVLSPLPLQFQTLSDSSKTYEPGSQYAEYIRRLPGGERQVQPETFMFEPYIQGQKSTTSPDGLRKESVNSNGSVSDPTVSPEGSPVTSPRRDKYRIPVKAWGQQAQGGGGGGGTSDTDSASCSSKSHESSPTGSPHRGSSRKQLKGYQSLDELTEEEILAAAAKAQRGPDKRTHMKRMMTVQGDESLDIQGLLRHRGRRNTTFGVDFQEQVDIFQTKVPPIVSKCLTEIEKRGVMIKGIYRVSGVKSKVEHLCQRFDIDPEAVDLTDVHPNIISNVLKLYLRQLPEPLLTYRLYSEFIHCAKENMSGQLQGDALILHLKAIVSKLPSSVFRTCAVLMHHLHRVASHAELNQMSASNLGIVFGPTLLRPLEGSASLASLVDTPHQTRAIELLVTHAQVVFGPSEDFQVAPMQTPIEQLSEALGSVLLPGQHIGSRLSASPAERSPEPVSELESQTLLLTDAATQPSASDYLLPGSASQGQPASPSQLSPALQAGLKLGAKGDINGEEGVDEEEEEEEDVENDLLLLPDQSKPHSDPLSVGLTPNIIAVPAGLPVHPSSPALTTGRKGMVTKSASSPAVSRANRPVISPSMSVTGTADSTGHLDSTLLVPSGHPLTKSSSFSHSPQDTIIPATLLSTSASTGSFLPQPGGEIDDLVKLDSSQGDGSASPSPTTKRPHSQQLENIKYLTKAPSVDELEDSFYPKINPVIPAKGLTTTMSQPTLSGKTPELTLPPSSGSQDTEGSKPAQPTSPTPTESKESSQTVESVEKQTGEPDIKDDKRETTKDSDVKPKQPVTDSATVDTAAKSVTSEEVTHKEPTSPKELTSKEVLVTVSQEPTLKEATISKEVTTPKDRVEIEETPREIATKSPFPTKPKEIQPSQTAGATDKDLSKPQTVPKTSSDVAESKGKSSRRSVLEEIPIPTVHSEVDGSAAVTLPASPTIKRREIPAASRIPTSPTIPRSSIATTVVKQGEKTDKRADQFRLEQRKLVMAIRSDEVLRRSNSPASETSSPRGSSSSTDRKSGIFEEFPGGGCALSASTVTGPRREEGKLEVKADKAVEPSSATVVPKTQGSEVGAKAKTTTRPASPTKPVGHRGVGTTPGEAKPALRGVRPLAMPSTVFTKKPATSGSPSSKATSSSPGSASKSSSTSSARTSSSSTGSSKRPTTDQSPSLASKTTKEESGAQSKSASSTTATRKPVEKSSSPGKVSRSGSGAGSKGDLSSGGKTSPSQMKQKKEGGSPPRGKPVQRKSSGGQKDSSRRVVDKSTSKSSTSSTSQAAASTSKAKTATTTTTTATSPSPTSSTTSTSSPSSRLSSDRTPRFV